MLTDLHEKGNFEPIHEAHAIEQVIFVVQFDDALDDDALEEVRKAAGSFKDDLPGQVEIQGFSLAIGAQGPRGTKPSGPASKLFRRVGPDGTVEDELRVDRDSVTFRTLLYSRWEAEWSRARRYFDAIIPIYLKQVKILGISLNYVDKFSWVGNVGECNPRMLLRAGSSYLCPHIFDAKDLWHSHTGAFIRIDHSTKRLLNINVDILDEPSSDSMRRVVVVTTVLTDLLNQPNYEPSVVAEADAMEFLDSHMKKLHADSKEVFSNIIDDKMTERIAL